MSSSAQVDAVGPGVTRIAPGDRVAVEPNYSCGACALCREGNRNLCLARTAVGIDVDGCFAELARVPERCCWPAPPASPTRICSSTEPLAVVVRAVGRGGRRGRARAAAVVGGGTLGLLAIQVLRARGVPGAGGEPHGPPASRWPASWAPRRAARGRRRPLEAAARRFSGREGVDVVVETAGTAEAVGPRAWRSCGRAAASC